MPQLNSDNAADDEPKSYNVEECEDDRWNENLNDIKVDLVEALDKDPRSGNKSNSRTEPSNNDRIEREDPRDEAKVPGRPYLYPHDIGSIVSSIPSFLHPTAGLPPNSKVPYPYNPYHTLLYGPHTPGDLDSKPGMSRAHHPDIPSMYSLPGQLGQIPHPLAPWPAPPIYPMCTASTISPMLQYANPFAAFTSAAAAAASNMPRFPHRPGMHPGMLPHPGLVSNGPLAGMGNGHHPHHGKHDDKSGRHSKGDSETSRPKRDRPYVKKPLNAFMLYMKEQRAKVVAECTLKESAAINQILGRKWHSLSREEQQKYYEMARKERQIHLQMHPGWSARDNYGKRKKRKKEKNQGECTAQNPKKCRAVFGLEQQQLWCAPCRRKKKCIRYQHDDDSDDDDFSPINSPHQYQGYQQQNPFDSGRTTSPPLSMTSQAMNSSSNSDFNSAASSSSRNNHSGATDQRPDIKQEFRSSPNAMDSMPPMPNGNGHDQFNGRPNGRNSSSENSYKSDGSPSNQDRHHGNNENSNNNNRKERPQQRQLHNYGDNSLHRQSSAPTSGGDHRSSFRKTNSLDGGGDLPGPSGLNARRNSDMPSHESSGHSNENSPRTHHSSSGSFSKPTNGPQPSPIHPQSGGMYMPHQNGTGSLLPMSPPYNHSPHSGFMPISPYLNALAFPPSPLSSPVLSLFKGISPSSIGNGMGGHSSGTSHASHSRGTPGAVVEGKS